MLTARHRERGWSRRLFRPVLVALFGLLGPVGCSENGSDRHPATLDGGGGSGGDAGGPGRSFCDQQPYSITGQEKIVAVDDPQASDNGPGTAAQPWKTLAKAGAAVQAGDVVLIRQGVYRETLTVHNSGAPDALIWFRAHPGDECQGECAGTKTGCKVILEGQGGLGVGVDLSRPSSHVRVEGLEIRNFSGDGVYFQDWYTWGVQGVQIVNNYIHDNAGDAVNARNAIDSLIENNEIYNNGATAVAFGGQHGCDGLTVRANNIHHNVKDGIQGEGKALLAEGNQLYDQCHTDAHQDGFDIGDLSDSIIRYNTVSDFTQLIYLTVAADTDDAIDNVQIYGNVLYTDRYWTEQGGEAPGIFVSSATGGSSYVRKIHVHSNTCGWLGYPCIRIYGGVGGLGPATEIIVRNNIMIDSGIDIEVGDDDEVSSDYNLFFSTPGSTTSVDPWKNEGPHSQVIDPKVQDYVRHQAWDFRLAPDSPAIDAGDPALGTVFSLPGDFCDIDGTRRPQARTYDIGAYERAGP